MLRLIGDVHGKFERYKKIMALGVPTIQVGDMGVGFYSTKRDICEQKPSNPPHYMMAPGNHRFIRGNHDNPNECKKHSQWIADGTVEEHQGKKIMFIGGAVSVDQHHRTAGYNWWADEELSIVELRDLQEKYFNYKPDVMITHEAPEQVAMILQDASGREKFHYPSRTRQAFQQYLHLHTPKLWVHGHWHYSLDHEWKGTRFVCLAELEWKDFDLSELT